jgi:hypothetical protein
MAASAKQSGGAERRTQNAERRTQNDRYHAARVAVLVLYERLGVMMRIVLALLLSGIVYAPAIAQGPAAPASEREAVLAIVQAFFDTMAAKDVAGARRILLPDGRFHAVRQQDGAPRIRAFTGEDYLKDLPGMKQNVRERMWNPEVRIRGPIASVWTPYDFWTDGKFSHCGVDAFDLIKTDEGWRIAGGTYTLESKCEPSPLGPLKQ